MHNGASVYFIYDRNKSDALLALKHYNESGDYDELTVSSKDYIDDRELNTTNAEKPLYEIVNENDVIDLY